MTRLAVFVMLVLTAACQARAQSADDRLRWKNGDELAGQIVSATADKLIWRSAVSSHEVTLDISVLDALTRPFDNKAALDPEYAAFRVRLALVQEMIGGPADIAPGLGSAGSDSDDGNCQLTYHDGTTLTGDLVGIENGIVTLQTADAPAPVTYPLAGLSVCKFRHPEDGPQPLAAHVLEHAGLRVRGTLSAAESTLGWRFIGASAAVPLNLDEPLTIRRTARHAAGPKSADADSDVVLLNSGDRLAGKVEGIEPDVITISTNAGAVIRISHDDVQAVSFDSVQTRLINGFQGDAWQIDGRNDKAVERRDDALIFHDAATVTHPTLLSGGSLEFDVDWNRTGRSQLVLTLMPKVRQPANRRLGGVFAGEGVGIVVEPNRQMFYLQFTGNQVQIVAIEGNVGRAFNPRRLQEQDPIHIRLQATDNKVILFVNDEEQAAFSVSDQQEGASAVMFATSQIRDNNRQRGGDVNMTLSKLRAGGGSGLFAHVPILKAAKQYVVTVPRMRRDRPPSHVLIGRNGDLLRGQLRALGPTSVQFESGLTDVVLPRDQLAGVIWLAETAPGGDATADSEPADPKPAPGTDAAVRTESTALATLDTGAALTLVQLVVEGEELVARHRVVGECRFPLAAIETLSVGDAQQQSDQVEPQPAKSEWTLVHAPEPVIPGDTGGFGTYSELVGQPAEDFALPLLSGGNFRLSDCRGEVVVLEFWATWCGPCIQAMPQIMAATDAFPGRVKFIAVNQDEDPDVIRTFLESRQWDLTVALDGRGETGRKYRVQGIPQTVIIGRDGTIEHVHLGASPDLESSLGEALERLVDESPPSPGE